MQRDWRELHRSQKATLIAWATLLLALALWSMWQHCRCSPQNSKLFPLPSHFQFLQNSAQSSHLLVMGVTPC